MSLRTCAKVQGAQSELCVVDDYSDETFLADTG